jgi:hypothetical protein
MVSLNTPRGRADARRWLPAMPLKKGENMKRIVMSFFTIVLAITPAFARVIIQQPAPSNCALTAANSPTVRDVRLGMSLQQVLALFPAASKRKEIKDAVERAKAATANDIVYLVFDSTSDGGGERFAGTDSILVGFYKGQVVDFNVSYVGPTWRTVDEWIEKIRQTWGLPAAQEWSVGPSENPSKILKCRGVEIEAGILGGGASIRVRNTEYNKGMGDGKEAIEERKRREFKP